MAYGFNDDKSMYSMGVQKVYTSGFELVKVSPSDTLTDYIELTAARLVVMQPCIGLLTLTLTKSKSIEWPALEKQCRLVIPDGISLYAGMSYDVVAQHPRQGVVWTTERLTARLDGYRSGAQIENIIRVTPHEAIPSNEYGGFILSGIVMLQGDSLVKAN